MELTVYAELYSNLQEERYATMRPFGRSLTYSLNHARFREDGYAVWEEEDYCSHPWPRSERLHWMSSLML